MSDKPQHKYLSVKQIGTELLLINLGSVFQVLLSILLIAILAKKYDPVEMGNFLLAFNTAVLISIFLDPGINNYLYRHFLLKSTYIDNIKNEVSWIRLSLIFTIVIIYFSISLALCDTLDFFLLQVSVLGFGIVNSRFPGVRASIESKLKAEGNFKALLYSQVLDFIFVITLALGFLLFEIPIPIYMFVSFIFLAFLPGFFYVILKTHGLPFLGLNELRTQKTQIFSYCLPVAAILILHALFNRIDIYFINLNQPASTVDFGLLQRFESMFQFIAVSIQTIMYRYLIGREVDDKNIKKRFYGGTLLVFSIGLASSVFLILFSDLIISIIFSPDYTYLSHYISFYAFVILLQFLLFWFSEWFIIQEQGSAVIKTMALIIIPYLFIQYFNSMNDFSYVLIFRLLTFIFVIIWYISLLLKTKTWNAFSLVPRN